MSAPTTLWTLITIRTRRSATIAERYSSQFGCSLIREDRRERMDGRAEIVRKLHRLAAPEERGHSSARDYLLPQTLDHESPGLTLLAGERRLVPRTGRRLLPVPASFVSAKRGKEPPSPPGGDSFGPLAEATHSHARVNPLFFFFFRCCARTRRKGNLCTTIRHAARTNRERPPGPGCPG